MGASGPDTPASAGLVRLVWATAILAVLFVGLQVAVVRPTQYPAGAGLVLADSAAVGALGDPLAQRIPRPPDVTADQAPIVRETRPGSPAHDAGVRAGDRVRRLVDGVGGEVTWPADPAVDSPPERLARWRAAWWLDVRRPFTLTVERDGVERDVLIAPRWFPDLPWEARAQWLARHAGGLVQMVVITAAGLLLLGLRVRGRTAGLMTLTMLINVAIGGVLVGGEVWLPRLLVGPVTLFEWIVMPLGFTVVGLAVLYFPREAALLATRPWVPWLLGVHVLPMLVPNVLAAAYLLGVDGVGAPVVWAGARPWIWATSFVVAVAGNVAIVLEGLQRYLHNPDANERRRIQVVVYTGVPAALAWAVQEGAPMLGALVTGRPIPLPWELSAVLHAVMLLPAVGLPYAVAVTRIFSPRTVIRRSLQYALARRTLTLLTVLPAVALVGSLIRQRDQPLVEIVMGRPLFYLVGIGLLVATRLYHAEAARWLDRRFFRAEYDAREILVSLAGRMPFETEPEPLVALVIDHVRSALHPASVAVVGATESGRFESIGAAGPPPPPLQAGGGLPTLLRWSREPFEVRLDDPRSNTARLPPADRAWLDAAGANLLVPVLSGHATDPALIGCLVLGPKRSEEPYTAEDRELLSAIAAQMAVSLDLSRLRRATTPTLAGQVTTVATGAALGSCPVCRRCVPLTAATCPDHPGTPLAPVAGLPPLIDGKYRVDALIGRGGMGAVYRAHDLRLARDVAVKVVRGELTASLEARARFQREAMVVARLQHPAVVAIHDVGTLGDGAAYLVMEYVRGEDLRQRLKRAGPLPPSAVVEVMTGIAAGVQAAHDAGVFHRDLKPENVLLTDAGTPKVLDFGVAKLAGPEGVDGTLTSAGTVAGTPAYMAPEQLRGRATGATDVYSLGVMTFELLTGRLPFGAGSLADIAVAQAGGRPDGADAIPAVMRSVVERALQYDPEARPATPAAFADLLRGTAGTAGAR
jgi:eukaryotic-like serine/threonine-protein kinase